jgi:hypothetical protein
MATENTENAEIRDGNVLPLRPLPPFRLIAGLMANSSENRLYPARMY